jgi:hypothetical protein
MTDFSEIMTCTDMPAPHSRAGVNARPPDEQLCPHAGPGRMRAGRPDGGGGGGGTGFV